MIVGNGSIAKAFIESGFDHKDYVIFASGVSDSNETDRKEFLREHTLLIQIIQQNPNKKLIYFTSILSETMSNKYYQHKRVMEKAIEIRAKDYIIYRIPQLIGRVGNNSNLIHFLKDSIENNKEIIVYNGITRAIFDVEDLVNFVDYSKDKVSRNHVNISYIEKLSVLDLVNLISSIIGKNPIYKIVEGEGTNWYLENSLTTLEWILFNKIEMKGYTEKVLRKYL